MTLEDKAASLSTTAWILIFTPFAIMFLCMVGKLWWGFMFPEPVSESEAAAIKAEARSRECQEEARRHYGHCSREILTRQGVCDRIFEKETKACP